MLYMCTRIGEKADFTTTDISSGSWSVVDGLMVKSVEVWKSPRIVSLKERSNMEWDGVKGMEG